MSKKTFVLLLTILPAILIIALISQASSQGQPKTLEYSNIVPEDEKILTIEGEATPVTIIYEKDTLYVRAEDILRAFNLEGQYDEERNIYVINGQDFYKRKVYEATVSHTGEKILFLPLIDFLKFIQVRYTMSELGTYPTVRVQTSSFALPTPTPAVTAGGTPAEGGDGEATPTPSPQQVFSQKCSKCHDTSKATSITMSSAEWGTTVRRMQAKEPGWINDEEANMIIQYLTGGQ